MKIILWLKLHRKIDLKLITTFRF